MTNPLKSVGSKLFFIFFISIVAFVLTVGLISYNISKNIISKNASASSVSMLQLGQSSLEYFYDSIEKASLQIFASSDVRTMMSQLSETDRSSYEYVTLRATLSERVMPIGLANNAIRSISVVGKDGSMDALYGSAIIEVGSNNAWMQQVYDLSGKSMWLQGGENSFSSDTSKIASARALIDPYTNEQYGLLLIEVPVSELMSEISDISLGQDSQVMIVTGNNKLINQVGTYLPGQDSPIALTDDQLKIGKDSFQTKDNLVAFAGSEVSNWTLVGGVPIESLTRDAAQIFELTIYMCLIAVVIAVIIGLIIIRMIARPLVNLMVLMREGAGGNLNIRANYKSKDEIGRLGRTFDEMMQEITTLVKQTNQSAQEVLETAVELTNTSKTTAIASREIAVATEQISGGAAGLAMESEKGSELTQRIGDKMKQVIDSNVTMGTAASNVRTSSENGIQYMNDLNSKTQAADDMIRSMVQKVDELKNSTQSIVKILDVLNKMTKQTNILSLNATIEAARAGEAGKGFRVVADEINQLAIQSRQSIDVVAQITETIQTGINETVTVLGSAYPIFQAQIEAVKEASIIFAHVQEDMGGFINQLSEVSDSIVELDESQNVLSVAMMNVSAVAEESLATSEEVASLSSEQLTISDNLVRLSDKLEQLSNSLKQSLSKFTY
ncbi:methyl-accepting chemotaxis protein [Paenibacillus albiflavus]|uniref:Methyl-accepting chemotaxis protein n=1 Tax=Paenibacillus albiflavus TaxID=2545760 RepID=A0A4R4EC62_9BACL|nr:methyl-accepting chemotaxis protein [Paenibacillus albiflavus]